MQDALSARITCSVSASADSQNATWQDRAVLYFGLSAITLSCYFGAQFFPLRDPVVLPLSMIDRAIPFEPAWSWMYQTIYLVTPAVALSLRTRGGLRRYLAAFLALLLPCGLAFFLLPVEGPVVDASGVDRMYDFIRSYAGTINCLPSLHVGMAALSLLFVHDVCEERGLSGLRSSFCFVGMVGWFLLLSYSTLALKQHYFIDIPTGAAVGFVAYRFSRRLHAE